MEIVIFTHPDHIGSQSMPRFAAMLKSGMEQRGHKVIVWTPNPIFYKIPASRFFKKWLGYIDQFLLFPISVKRRLQSVSPNTLFVFADQALGPWVPMVSNRPHVIHCHDFLAQRSALGEVPENTLSESGKRYQQYIRKGFNAGKNFISISYRTQEDLHRFLTSEPKYSKVVYNGLNQNFETLNINECRNVVAEAILVDVQDIGYLLHVGGNQWYKNRVGVIDIYDAWRKMSPNLVMPLILIGNNPSDAIHDRYLASPYKDDIHFLTGKSDDFVRSAYAGASLFVFPSLAEGFGWPIIEAMASGCIVLTTGLDPMMEVGGKAALYIPAKPYDNDLASVWARESAKTIDLIFNLPDIKRNEIIMAGLDNARRFKPEESLKQIEEIYENIVKPLNKR